MCSDKVQIFLSSPITGLIIVLILAALAASGRFSVSVSNILLICAFLIGCFGIFRSGYGVHLSIIFSLLLGIGLTCISWWIQRLPQEPRQIVQSDLLLPGDEKTPNLHIPCGRPPGVPEKAVTIAKGEMVLLVGDFAISTAEKSFVVLKLYGKDLLTMTRVDNGISVSTDIWDEEGKILATIENNQFRVNPNKTIPLIRPDPHTLIVEDERKVCVLSVRFLNPSTIKIGGIFRAGGRYAVIVGKNEITFGPLLIKGGIALHVKGRSIFEWPGQFPNTKLSIDDKIETDKATLRLVSGNNGCNIVIKDHHGEEYSLVQVGGSDVPEGTKLWIAAEFQLRSTDVY